MAFLSIVTFEIFPQTPSKKGENPPNTYSKAKQHQLTNIIQKFSGSHAHNPHIFQSSQYQISSVHV
jgi:hypothetical protein